MNHKKLSIALALISIIIFFSAGVFGTGETCKGCLFVSSSGHASLNINPFVSAASLTFSPGNTLLYVSAGHVAVGSNALGNVASTGTSCTTAIPSRKKATFYLSGQGGHISINDIFGKNLGYYCPNSVVSQIGTQGNIATEDKLPGAAGINFGIGGEGYDCKDQECIDGIEANTPPGTSIAGCADSKVCISEECKYNKDNLGVETFTCTKPDCTVNKPDCTTKPETPICDPTSKACVQCLSDTDCSNAGDTCVSNVCTAATPTEPVCSPACTAGFTCVGNNKCEATCTMPGFECADNNACNSYGVCDNTKKCSPACDTASVCELNTNGNPVCVPNGCIPGSSDSRYSCPNAFVCNANTFKCEPTPTGCQTKNDCNSKEVCVSGSCVLGDCLTDSDCASAGGVCTDNKCTTPGLGVGECTTDNNCGDGLICGSKKLCVPGCKPVTKECPVDYQECGSDNLCVGKDCSTDRSVCGDYAKCVSGNCAGMCVQDTDCASASEYCDDDGACKTYEGYNSACTNDAECGDGSRFYCNEDRLCRLSSEGEPCFAKGGTTCGDGYGCSGNARNVGGGSYVCCVLTPEAEDNNEEASCVSTEMSLVPELNADACIVKGTCVNGMKSVQYCTPSSGDCNNLDPTDVSNNCKAGDPEPCDEINKQGTTKDIPFFAYTSAIIALGIMAGFYVIMNRKRH